MLRAPVRLTTWITAHLVGVPEVAQRSGLKIVLPSELLEKIRRQADND
jgi:hypothetical protein